MSLAYRLSAFNRKRKWDLFLSEMHPVRTMRILDVGFSEEEYSSTDNYLERNYPYPEMITALGVDAATKFRDRYPQVTVVQYDGGAFPFADKAFDILWSNAVIEHVGDRIAQLAFLKEVRRVAHRAFITTPNRFFPIEVHTRIPFVHYLPKGACDACLRFVGKKWATGNYMNLLSLAEFKSLLANAGVEEYKVFKNRLGGFTVDFVIIF